MYFKILKDEQVINLGKYIVYYHNNYLTYCSLDKAQYIQDYKQQQLYHDFWLKSPKENSIYIEATIMQIEEEEYNNLLALFEQGEPIPPEEPEEPKEPEEELEEEPIEEPEDILPSSLPEIRAKINELSELIQTSDKPFKAIQTYYKGDFITHGSRIYVATNVIIKDETIIPNINCIETTLATVLEQLQKEV